MEKRVRFSKGKQREFFNLVIGRLNCRNLRRLLQFGLDVSYDSLKNYYTERRSLPKELFDNLCYLAKINPHKINCNILNANYCYILGGLKSKRGKINIKKSN